MWENSLGQSLCWPVKPIKQQTTQPTDQVIISKVKHLFEQQITLTHKKFNLFPPAFVHEEESWVTGDTTENYIALVLNLKKLISV